ncbi:MAG: DMT family transporter [Rikenellaceae bacterium]
MNLSTKLLATLACILWGSAFASAKYAFGFMPPILLSGMRFTLAGLLLLPLLRYQKVDIFKEIKENWKFMSVFAFMQTFLQYGIFYMGLDRVPADISAIIIGAGPLFVVVMAHFTMKGEKITTRKMLALLLALSGVAFISWFKGGVAQESNAVFYIGVCMLIFSNIIGSYTNIMVAKYKNTLSPILLTSFANFTGGLMLFGCGFALEDFPSHSLNWQFYASLLWLAVIPAAGFSIWYSLLQRKGVKVSDLNMWKFIIPVSGCVLSWIFLKSDEPNLYSVVGIVVITLALRLYNGGKSK